jgi:hypothetical protein
MTAFAEDFMKLWTQSDQDSERKMVKHLLNGLDAINQEQSDILSRLKVGKPTGNPIIRWMEQRGYPTAVTGTLVVSTTDTMTFSGTVAGETMSAKNIKQIIRVGTILENEDSNFQVKVTDVTGLAGSSPFTATVEAHGGTTPASDSAATTYRIISEAWTDYKEVDDARELNRFFRKVGCQILAETFEIPETRRNTDYEIVGDETEHQIKELLSKLRRQQGYIVTRGRPEMSGGVPVYGDTVEESHCCGLFTWPEIVQAEEANTNTYVDLSGEAVGYTALNNLVLQMRLTENTDFNMGNWIVACHPNAGTYIDQFDESIRRTTQDTKKAGYQITTLMLQGKEFPVVRDQYVRPDQIGVINLSDCSYGYYKNDQMKRKELSTQGRFYRWLISFQMYGVVVRKPRQNIGLLYGGRTVAAT